MNENQLLDRFVAKSQFVLAYSALFALFFVIAAVVGVLLAGIKVPVEVLTLLTSLTTGLVALASMGYGYFFQRQRPHKADGDPDETGSSTAVAIAVPADGPSVSSAAKG